MKRFFKTLTRLFLFLLFSILVGTLFQFKTDIPATVIKHKYELPHSQYTSFQDMEVHFTREGQGKPLVLLHGTGSSIHTWNEWTHLLKDSFEIIRVDLPGFGLTGPNPSDDYSNEAYLRFLETFFEQMNLDKAHLAGNSFGGYLSWLFALHYPNKVDQLILVDPAGYPLPKDKPVPLGFRMLNYPVISTLFESITPTFMVKKTVYDSYENDAQISEETMQRYCDLLLREGNRRGMIQRVQQIKDVFWQQIPDIKTPTLILWGEKDGVLTVDNAPRFHQDLPNSTLIIYPNVGHLPMEEVAEQSAKDVLQFLDVRY